MVRCNAGRVADSIYLKALVVVLRSRVYCGTGQVASRRHPVPLAGVWSKVRCEVLLVADRKGRMDGS